ncbi:MAG: hypothetical protein GXP45_02285 [bacterium]|nr:hypothetical protein [bacterium]
MRPEMTPSLMRMITKKYTQLSKPIRYFSIANFYRNERPQRGRNREFWQLNVDLFGSESLMADVEILEMAIALMQAFHAPSEARELRINNRKLIGYILNTLGEISDEQKIQIVRTMDKREKLSEQEFIDILQNYDISTKQSNQIIQYLQIKDFDDLIKHFPDIQDNL